MGAWRLSRECPSPDLQVEVGEAELAPGASGV